MKVCLECMSTYDEGGQCLVCFPDSAPDVTMFASLIILTCDHFSRKPEDWKPLALEDFPPELSESLQSDEVVRRMVHGEAITFGGSPTYYRAVHSSNSPSRKPDLKVVK